MTKTKGFKCDDKRPCFARRDKCCTILSGRPKGLCRFCKPERDVTKGKKYDIPKEVLK